MVRPYPPGTTLVLKNQNGGRLFTVFEDRGEEGIVELAMMSSQQKYRQPHRRCFLVNHGSTRAAHQLVQRLETIAERRRAAVYKAEQEANRAFEVEYQQAEVETDLEDAD